MTAARVHHPTVRAGEARVSAETATERLPSVRLTQVGTKLGTADPDASGNRLRYGGRVRRYAAAAALLGWLAIACGSAAAGTEPACRTMAPRGHTNAVFGHFATLAEAKVYKAEAAARVFKGLQIVNNGCGDYEVFIGGADRPSDRSSFFQEAHKAGFHITFQQTAPPMRFEPKHVVGVLGSVRSIAKANALMWALSDRGFYFLDLARSPTRWLVVMPAVPIKDALSIAHEVATAGFHIQFRPGTQG
jgi:hypothetical protein